MKTILGVIAGILIGAGLLLVYIVKKYKKNYRG